MVGTLFLGTSAGMPYIYTEDGNVNFRYKTSSGGEGYSSIRGINDALNNRIPLSGANLSNGSKLTTSTGGFTISANGGGSTLHLCGCSYLNLRSPGIQCRTFTDSGWAGISASSFTNQSSKRYKENINLMSEERAHKILDIDIVTFDYKDGIVDHHQKDIPGVIAEYIATEFPDIVHYAMINGEKLPDTVDYVKFIPYLIKMLQLQQAQIDDLISEVDDLKNR